jgi:hypothetical protein
MWKDTRCHGEIYKDTKYDGETWKDAMCVNGPDHDSDSAEGKYSSERYDRDR